MREKTYQCLIEILLSLIEAPGSYSYNSRRQLNVVGSSGLGASQQYLVENLLLQSEHGCAAFSDIPTTLDRVQHVLVEVTEMEHHAVAALVAYAFCESIMQRLARAARLLAEVEGVRIHAQEANQRIELAHAVLQRCSCEHSHNSNQQMIKSIRNKKSIYYSILLNNIKNYNIK